MGKPASKGKSHSKENAQAGTNRTYYKGVKQPLSKRPKLTRNVVNKTFKTDEELTTFILNEGTFKDRITAMTLLAIKEKDEKCIEQLLEIAEDPHGGDKSYMAITHALKIIAYYNECKKEAAELEKHKSQGTPPQEPEVTAENEQNASENALFVSFIDSTRLVKGLTDAISAQFASPFQKKKIAVLIKIMVTSGTLEVQGVNVLLSSMDTEVLKEVTAVVEIIIKKDKKALLEVVKEKVIEVLQYNHNVKTVKFAMNIASMLDKKSWIKGPGDYKEYVIPLVRGYGRLLKIFYEEMYKEKKKDKKGYTGMWAVLTGLMKLLRWERTAPEEALPDDRVAKFMKEYGYIIFKLAYHDNVKYSLPALNLLELVSETEKINYTRVLEDTIKRYTYMKESRRCEILNKAINQKEEEIQSKIISSSYLSQICGKYTLGCHMVTSECCSPLLSKRIGLLLHRKSYDKDISLSAAKLLQGGSVPVYNLWETDEDE